MKILVIDDEKSIRLSLVLSLKKMGLDVIEAGSGEEGLELFKEHKPRLAIVDIKLPGMDGIDVLQEIKKIDKKCHVIMITYLSEVKLAVKAMKLGAYDYLTKPFSLDDIKSLVTDTIEYTRIKDSIDRIPTTDDKHLIGNSKAMDDIRSIINKVASMSFNTCILIEGESGVGKEVVANAIRKLKGLEDDKYVAINCAAIPSSLQESELFGYEKGAFTEAKTDKTGLIEKADGGILFLDEVADMDMRLQAKMLRVLQEKKFRVVGSTKEKPFDATIISACNKDLEKEISEGNFRKDLYYRLNVIKLYIPPLRKRKEDIPFLVNHFIGVYNNKLGKNVLSISKEVQEVFKSYDWPGNIRELKNVIERIMIFKDEEQIVLEDIPAEILDYNTDNIASVDDGASLDEVEKAAILKALSDNKWNITHTASKLGISRLTLRRKIEKYEISRD